MEFLEWLSYILEEITIKHINEIVLKRVEQLQLIESFKTQIDRLASKMP